MGYPSLLLGGVKRTSFQNYGEEPAGRETKVVFIPEAHFPRMPRVVDLQACEKREKGVTENSAWAAGKQYPFRTAKKEAVQALMERNLPGVMHNRHTKVVFIAESRLPGIPGPVNYLTKHMTFFSMCDRFIEIETNRGGAG